MAAKKIKPVKSNQKKGVLRGKMPTKRSINLVLVNENKINPLLALLGIQLPVSDTVLYYVFLALSLVLQAAVYYFTMNRVAVTYGHAYEALLAEHHENEKNAPKRPPLRIILNPKRFKPEEDQE